MNSIYAQPHIEVSVYPSSVLSGWLPSSSRPATWTAFYDALDKAVLLRKKTHAAPSPALKPLRDFLTGQGKNSNGEPLHGTYSAKFFFDLACDQNRALKNSPNAPKILRIYDADTLVNYLDALLNMPPSYYAEMLVGLPFSAVFASVDATMAGSRCFNLPEFNKIMSDILKKWQSYLDSEDSGKRCFGEEGKEWLTEKAKKSYDFDLWVKDQESLPYWKTWNSFFIRQFKNAPCERPIAAPNSNRIVCSPNDGQLFRWDMDIKEDDIFWLKDMNYSMHNIFSSPDHNQQLVIDKHKLVDKFKGGYIFQTFLNPNNYHRWWAPVNGKILFDPFVIPGVFFNKLIKPDFAGATTASLPFLLHVNSRGLIVFDTEDYGLVCCIPIGMSEVSTVEFDPNIKEGASVTKGQEIGKFKYGGSSFAMIFQNVPGKELIFHSGEHLGLYPSRPTVPTEVSVVAGITIKVGQQIGMWIDRTTDYKPCRN